MLPTLPRAVHMYAMFLPPIRPFFVVGKVDLAEGKLPLGQAIAVFKNSFSLQDDWKLHQGYPKTSSNKVIEGLGQVGGAKENSY